MDFGFVLNASVDTLTSDIVTGQKDIRVFLFSGHSGGSGLDFVDADFTSGHLVRFFNTISSDDSKIDCVVLNGCENAEIVRHLSHVPVVIGTKSKINDDVARKFTYDFFRTLIESESSYKQAFVDAIAAQDTISSSMHTRGEGGGDIPETIRLNDYFLFINDEEVAEGKFPFKKLTRNWTKYVFILLLVVAGVLAYLFRHPIEQMWRGYSCTKIHNGIDKSKCNFVIGDISAPEMEDFEQWLYENIRTSSDIRAYLNCINIGSFDDVIINNALDRDSLPRICGYDFNMTGSVTEDHGKLRAEFNIFPFDPDRLSSSTFVYQVESLSNLDTLITFLDTNQANKFVLFELCASCAAQGKYKEILPSMQSLLAEYKYDTATAVSFQRLQQRLSDVALTAGDTAVALKALDNLAAAKQNNFELWALEEKTKIFEAQNDLSNQLVAQTAYLTAMEKRLPLDARIIREEPRESYIIASKQIQSERAVIIAKQNNELIDNQNLIYQDPGIERRVFKNESSRATHIPKKR